MKSLIYAIIIAFCYTCFYSCSNQSGVLNGTNEKIVIEWLSSTTSKYNRMSSDYQGFIITIRIRNNSDSIFYISNEYGEFYTKNHKNEKLRFLANSHFNNKILYPKSTIYMQFIKPYHKTEIFEPNESDFDIELYYKLHNKKFNKALLYNELPLFEKKKIDTSNIYLVDSCFLHKIKGYRFTWISEKIEWEEEISKPE